MQTSTPDVPSSGSDPVPPVAGSPAGPAEPVERPVATSPPPAPATSAPVPSEPAKPSPGTPSPMRGRLKIVGVAVMLVAGFLCYVFAGFAYAGPEPSTWSQIEGGNLTVVVVGVQDAQVTFRYHGAANDTTLATDADAKVVHRLSRAYATVEATWPGGSARQDAIVLPQMAAEMRLDPASPPPADAEPVGYDISGLRLYWMHAVAYGLAVVGGAFTLALRAPRLAMATSLIGLTITLYVALGSLSPPFLIALVVFGFAVWFIRKGRGEFKPLLVGSIHL